MVMVVMRLAGRLNILLQRAVGLLSCREISRLQSRTHRGESLGDRVVAVQGARNILAQGAEIRLGLAEVSSLEILPQLLKLALDFLKLRLPSLQTLT